MREGRVKAPASAPGSELFLILSHTQESEQIHLRIHHQLKLQGSFSFTPELSAILISGRLQSSVEQSCSQSCDSGALFSFPCTHRAPEAPGG